MYLLKFKHTNPIRKNNNNKRQSRKYGNNPNTHQSTRFASFHLNGPLQIYVHCLNHWLILCECWRTSEGNHWQVLPSNLSAFAILQIRQWLLDFRHVARHRNSEKIPTGSMEKKVVNFYWTQLIRSLQSPQVQTPLLGFPKLFQYVYPCVQEILTCQDWFWKLYRWLIVYHLQSQMKKWKQRGNESITHKLASADCWKVATNSDKLPSDLAPYHFTTFWWITQKWNIHKLRLWILKIQLYFWSWNEVLHCSSCGQSSSSFLPIK